MATKATRETQISTAFVAIADTLTTDFDVVDLLHTLVDKCTEILDTIAGGLMLVDSDHNLQLMTSTSEGADLVEVMQLAGAAGPCIQCFETGEAVSVPDISAAEEEWPVFAKAALGQGFKSAHATPMKLRGRVIGTMNLFSDKQGALSKRDIALAQALTDAATIGILQERLVAESSMLTEQLHRALDSRVLIEQAKGIISHSLNVDMDDAFAYLRAHARSHNLTLRAVALSLSDRTLSTSELEQPAVALSSGGRPA